MANKGTGQIGAKIHANPARVLWLAEEGSPERGMFSVPRSGPKLVDKPARLGAAAGSVGGNRLIT